MRESIDNDPHSRQLVKSYILQYFLNIFISLVLELRLSGLKKKVSSFPFPTELTAKQCHNYLADRFTLEKNIFLFQKVIMQIP